MTDRRNLLLATLLLVFIACLAHQLLRASIDSLNERIADSSANVAGNRKALLKLSSQIARLKTPPTADTKPFAVPVAATSATSWMQKVASHPQIRALWLRQMIDHLRLRSQPILSRLGYSKEKQEAYYALVAREQEKYLDLQADAAKRGSDLNDPSLSGSLHLALSESNAATAAYFASDLKTWSDANSAAATLEFILDQALDPSYSPAEQATLRDILTQHRSGQNDYDLTAVSVAADTVLGPERAATFTTATRWALVRSQMQALARSH